MLTVGSLFSGIGGLDLGLERAGMRILWQCESDPYCRAVLRKHWPDVPCFEDIRALAVSTGDGRGSGRARGSIAGGSGQSEQPLPTDVLAGGFPCQPVSYAGKRRAQEDARWLWPHYARLIRVLRPLYIVVENVPGLRNAGMGDVLGDLARLGYDAEWESLPAAAFGAHHLRDRVWLVAYTNDKSGRAEHGLKQEARAAFAGSGSERAMADPTSPPLRRRSHERGAVRQAVIDQQEPVTGDGRSSLADPYGAGSQGWEIYGERAGEWLAGARSTAEQGIWRTEPDVGRVANGIPSRVDRLRALGNAVVPQVAEYVGRAIVTAHLAVLERSAKVSV